MDLSVILTYRCDSRCSMCHIWKNPTHPNAEVGLETLRKLPGGFDHLNLTGGEPSLRRDLADVVELLHPRAAKLEISTNGLHRSAIEPIVKRHPDIKIRISVEGFEGLNDTIRGEENGFQRKLDTMKGLIQAGGRDLGFATTFQDENIDQVVDLYRLARRMNVEFATSSVHNGFQFHKNDNFVYDRVKVARRIEDLVTEMLRSRSVKDWFRAYLNLGLMAKILGQDRLMPCMAGTDFLFLDPWSDVYACNVRPDLHLGNLAQTPFSEILEGPRAAEVRSQVSSCRQNCWMVASAKTAMRNKRFARIPKLGVLAWVIENKIRATFGFPIHFDRFVDYSSVHADADVVRRISYLGKSEKRNLQPSQSPRYGQFDGFQNR